MSDAKHPVTARVSLPDGRFLAGCCRVPAHAPRATTATLEGVSWRLDSLTGKDPAVLAALPRQATARFAAGRVTGFSGCNNFTGGYTLDGDRLKLGPLAGTMMACPDPEMAIETAFRAVLMGTVRHAVTGGRLSLTAESGAVLGFAPAPPPGLEGVTWDVISPVAGTRITFSFGDGMASGNAGCNTFRAPYSSQGSGIRIGPAATTRKACAEEPMVQERELLAALESAVTWSVDGNMLDMHRADKERALTGNAMRQ
jgi:heat shock protein HslJ